MGIQNKTESNFDELLKSLAEVGDEVETMSKKPAMTDDKTVKAAAEDGDKDKDEDEEEGQEFGKSLGTDDDGNDLVDATELVKSLLARQESTEGTLAKAMTSMVGAMSKQNDLIKSLQADVKTLSAQGRGRKALLSVAEKPGVSDTLAKSGAAEDDGTITPAELLAKSNAAYSAGKLSGVELNTVDVCLRSGWPIDAGILRKVAAA